MIETPDLNYDSLYNHMTTPIMDISPSQRDKLDSLDLEEFVLDIRHKHTSNRKMQQRLDRLEQKIDKEQGNVGNVSYSMLNAHMRRQYSTPKPRLRTQEFTDRRNQTDTKDNQLHLDKVALGNVDWMPLNDAQTLRRTLKGRGTTPPRVRPITTQQLTHRASTHRTSQGTPQNLSSYQNTHGRRTPQDLSNYTNRAGYGASQDLSNYTNIGGYGTPSNLSQHSNTRHGTPQNLSGYSNARPLPSFRSTPRLFSAAYEPSPRIENSILTQRSHNILDRDIEDFEGAIGRLREALHSRRGTHRSPNISRNVSNLSIHESPDRNKENEWVTRNDLEARYKLLLSQVGKADKRLEDMRSANYEIEEEVKDLTSFASTML